MEAITLGGFITFLPTAIIYLTQKIKPLIKNKKMIFLVPLTLSTLAHIAAFFTFGGNSLAMYCILGVYNGINAMIAYAAANGTKQEKEDVAAIKNLSPSEMMGADEVHAFINEDTSDLPLVNK